MGNSHVRKPQAKGRKQQPKEVRRMRSFTPNNHPQTQQQGASMRVSRSPIPQTTRNGRIAESVIVPNQAAGTRSQFSQPQFLQQQNQNSYPLKASKSSNMIPQTMKSTVITTSQINGKQFQQQKTPSFYEPQMRSRVNTDSKTLSPMNKRPQQHSQIVNISPTTNPLENLDWLEVEKKKRRQDRENSFLGRTHDHSTTAATFEQQISTFSRSSFKKPGQLSANRSNQEKDFMQSMEFAANYRLAAPLFSGPTTKSLVQLSLLSFDQSLLTPQQKNAKQQPEYQSLQNYLQFINDLESNAVQSIDFVDISHLNSLPSNKRKHKKNHHAQYHPDNINEKDLQDIATRILSDEQDQLHQQQQKQQKYLQNHKNQANFTPLQTLPSNGSGVRTPQSSGIRVNCNDTSHHHNADNDPDDDYIEMSDIHSQKQLQQQLQSTPNSKVVQPREKPGQQDPFQKNVIDSRPNGFSNVSSIILNNSSNELAVEFTPKSAMKSQDPRTNKQKQQAPPKRQATAAFKGSNDSGSDQNENDNDSSPRGFGIQIAQRKTPTEQQFSSNDGWSSEADQIREFQHKNITKAFGVGSSSYMNTQTDPKSLYLNKHSNQTHHNHHNHPRKQGDFKDSRVISDIARIEEEEQMRSIAWKYAEQAYIQEQRKAEIERMLLDDPRDGKPISKRSNFQEHTEKQARLHELAEEHLAHLQKEKNIKQRVDLFSEATMKRQEDERKALQLQSESTFKNGSHQPTLYQKQQPLYQQPLQSQQQKQQAQKQTTNAKDKYVQSYQGENTYSSKHKDKKVKKLQNEQISTGIQIVRKPLFQESQGIEDEDDNEAEREHKGRESVYQTGYYKDKESEIVSLITSNNMFRPPGAAAAATLPFQPTQNSKIANKNNQVKPSNTQQIVMPMSVANQKKQPIKFGVGVKSNQHKQQQQQQLQQPSQTNPINKKSVKSSQEDEEMLRVLNESAINRLDIFQDFEDAYSDDEFSTIQHNPPRRFEQEDLKQNTRQVSSEEWHQIQQIGVKAKQTQQGKPEILKQPAQMNQPMKTQFKNQIQKKQNNNSPDNDSNSSDGEPASALLNDIKKQVAQLSGRIRTDQKELDSSILSYTQKINQRNHQPQLPFDNSSANNSFVSNPVLQDFSQQNQQQIKKDQLDFKQKQKEINNKNGMSYVNTKSEENGRAEKNVQNMENKRKKEEKPPEIDPFERSINSKRNAQPTSNQNQLPSRVTVKQPVQNVLSPKAAEGEVQTGASAPGNLPVFHKALSEYEYSGISAQGSSSSNPISKTLVVEKEPQAKQMVSSIAQQLKDRRDAFEAAAARSSAGGSNAALEFAQQVPPRKMADSFERNINQSKQSIDEPNFKQNNPFKTFQSNQSIPDPRDSFQFGGGGSATTLQQNQQQKQQQQLHSEQQEQYSQPRRSSELFNFLSGVAGNDFGKAEEAYDPNNSRHEFYKATTSNDSDDDDYEYKDVSQNNQGGAPAAAGDTSAGFDFGAFGDDNEEEEDGGNDYTPAKIHIDINSYKRY